MSEARALHRTSARTIIAETRVEAGLLPPSDRVIRFSIFVACGRASRGRRILKQISMSRLVAAARDFARSVITAPCIPKLIAIPVTGPLARHRSRDLD